MEMNIHLEPPLRSVPPPSCTFSLEATTGVLSLFEVHSGQALASTQMWGHGGSFPVAAPREGRGTLRQQERGAHDRLL